VLNQKFDNVIDRVKALEKKFDSITESNLKKQKLQQQQNQDHQSAKHVQVSLHRADTTKHTAPDAAKTAAASAPNNQLQQEATDLKNLLINVQPLQGWGYDGKPDPDIIEE
jgi:hypothetical protein